MKKILISMLMLVVSLSLSAQGRFVIQNGENSQVYTTFQNAFAALVDGDTLYIPGGTYIIGDINIDKKVTMVGAGHYPAHTTATGLTILQGNIRFITGSDYSHIQGFYLTGGIQLGTSSSNQAVSYITISRSNLNGIKLYASSPATAQNIHITENVIRGSIDGGNAQHVLIEKNIVTNIYNFNNNVLISNNIVLQTNGDTFQHMYTCVFQNNVILHNGSYFLYASSSNTFLNNLFVKTITFSPPDYGSGNIISQPLASIFVNYPGGAFSYDFDFHLQETSPGNNAGTDGFDIGIYGTAVPYKEGAVPFNPHITSQEVSPGTNEAGEIEVNIQVEAQNR
jgi:hypothetical protein